MNLIKSGVLCFSSTKDGNLRSSDDNICSEVVMFLTAVVIVPNRSNIFRMVCPCLDKLMSGGLLHPKRLHIEFHNFGFEGPSINNSNVQ